MAYMLLFCLSSEIMRSRNFSEATFCSPISLNLWLNSLHRSAAAFGAGKTVVEGARGCVPGRVHFKYGSKNSPVDAKCASQGTLQQHGPAGNQICLKMMFITTHCVETGGVWG